MATAYPGITWRGVRGAATKELAIRIDARWMNAIQGAAVSEWWLPLIDIIPVGRGVEAVALPISIEDLSTFEEDVGPRVAPRPSPLVRVTIPRKPWAKRRSIPTRDLTMNNFAGWPDRFAGILQAARRTIGRVITDMLLVSDQTSMNVYKGSGYEGPPLIGTGHKANPLDPGVTETFDTLHTSANFDMAGWEAAKEIVYARPGPDGAHGLDLEITYVLGGTKMKKKFDRLFKRVIVLEDSAANDAAAGVTNQHFQEGVIPIVTSWLDRHPWLLANPGKDQWWTISTTLMARPFGLMLENGGAPTIDVLDVGSEYEILHEEIYIQAKMGANAAPAFPHVLDEWRGS